MQRHRWCIRGAVQSLEECDPCRLPAASAAAAAAAAAAQGHDPRSPDLVVSPLIDGVALQCLLGCHGAVHIGVLHQHLGGRGGGRRAVRRGLEAALAPGVVAVAAVLVVMLQ
jgi:hypothetical protein